MWRLCCSSPGKVNRLMMMGPGDVDEQLLGNGIRDGLIIGEDGAVESAATGSLRGQNGREEAHEADQALE